MTEWKETLDRIARLEKQEVEQWKWIDSIFDYMRDKDPDIDGKFRHMFPH